MDLAEDRVDTSIDCLLAETEEKLRRRNIDSMEHRNDVSEFSIEEKNGVDKSLSEVKEVTSEKLETMNWLAINKIILQQSSKYLDRLKWCSLKYHINDKFNKSDITH